MKVQLLASAPQPPHQDQFLTSFLVNETVAIDAGCVGFWGEPDDQAKIDHVFLTHSHADHICSLPMLLLNGYEARGAGVAVYGNGHVLECLRTDVFNDRVWPDFVNMSDGGKPFLSLECIESEQTVVVGDLQVTPVAVDHVVPAFGYIVQDASATVVFCPDTAPTDRIWEVAREHADLEAVFLGAAFPEAMKEMARISAHLVPSQFAQEVSKVGEHIPFIAVHIKPRYRDEIIRELQALGLESLEIGVCGREYDF